MECVVDVDFWNTPGPSGCSNHEEAEKAVKAREGAAGNWVIRPLE